MSGKFSGSSARIAAIIEAALENFELPAARIAGQLGGGQVAPGSPGSPGVLDPGDFLTDPTTTEGDLIYRGPVSLTRLGVGTAGQFLRVVGGIPAWATLTWAMVTSTPTTLSGYGITDAVSSTATRTANAVFAGPTSGSPAAATFRALVAADLPSSADLNARVAVKKNGTLVGTRRAINLIEGTNVTLSISDDSGNEEVDVTIAASGGGGGGASALDDLTDVTLSSPSSGEVLTYNGSAWINQTPSGGGGATIGKVPLDDRTLDSTYGDHFTGSSLDGKWSRRNISSGDHAYQLRDGSYMRIALWGGDVNKAIYQTAPGGSNYEVQCKEILLGLTQTIVGPFIVDSSGNGALCSFNTRTDDQFVIWSLSGWALSSAPAVTTTRGAYHAALYGAFPIWFGLRRNGTAITANFSVDGFNWAGALAATISFTPAYIGVGRLYNDSSHWVDLDWFDVVA